MPKLALGVDFGTSGVRLAVIDPAGETLVERGSPYPGAFERPELWRDALIALMLSLPLELRQQVGALALAGTSGTLLLCHGDGSLLDGALSQALPYHLACPEQVPEARRLLGTDRHPAGQASGSLARALRLLEASRRLASSSPLLIRHQADWLMGWLLGDWHWGEEGNNLRLGWDLMSQGWLGTLGSAPWACSLPEIVASGTVLGGVAPSVASSLGLPESCQVVAGTTDANAGVLAAAPSDDEGITVLGTTLVVKQTVPCPIQAEGVSCHRLNGRWLIGGASNTGAGILMRYFDPDQVKELSRQINAKVSGNLRLLPLLSRGERFPVDDPQLEPILEPRPVSDAAFLQALLEGITRIEQQGWQRFKELGAPPIRRVITLGGGARNPQWRLMRERMLGLPILNRPELSAALGMARLAQARMEASVLGPPDE
ncbi:MAG: FGGY-family carbohydrate kinase [Cyanobacteriota bacterium]|nr:FGGY-family carbohydrate kinase [Cyanobacteriota bacterium]